MDGAWLNLEYICSLQALQEASFWFTLVLTVMLLIIPVLAWRFYFHDVHPTLSDRVRLKQRVTSAKYVLLIFTWFISTKSYLMCWCHCAELGQAETSHSVPHQHAEVDDLCGPVTPLHTKKASGRLLHQEKSCGRWVMKVMIICWAWEWAWDNVCNITRYL